MKKKLLAIFLSLFVIFLIVAVVFFYLMKKNKPSEGEKATQATQGTIDEDYYEQEELKHFADKLEFLRMDTQAEIKGYADETEVSILESDDATLFAIGELYIEGVPVEVVYKLNEDGSINRLDGGFTVELEVGDAYEVGNLLILINNTVMTLFDLDWLEHSVYTSDGASMDPYADDVDEKILRGEASFAISLYDQEQTYWYCRAEVVEGKTFKCSFFRCFDPDVYADESPNVDLREETGVE